MAEVVAASESRLPTIDGVGPVVAARLLGRTDTASRFPTAAAFASYCGTAPIEISSADKTRHRLSRPAREPDVLAAALHEAMTRGADPRGEYEAALQGRDLQTFLNRMLGEAEAGQ